MPKINREIKENIKSIPKSDLEKLVRYAATKSQEFYDYLMINYFDTASGEQEIFEKAKNDLDQLFIKSYKGFSKELKLANMLAACNKRIVEFSKVCKDKSLEMDLIFYVLEKPGQFYFLGRTYI